MAPDTDGPDVSDALVPGDVSTDASSNVPEDVISAPDAADAAVDSADSADSADADAQPDVTAPAPLCGPFDGISVEFDGEQVVSGTSPPVVLAAGLGRGVGDDFYLQLRLETAVHLDGRSEPPGELTVLAALKGKRPGDAPVGGTIPGGGLQLLHLRVWSKDKPNGPPTRRWLMKDSPMGCAALTRTEGGVALDVRIDSEHAATTGTRPLSFTAHWEWDDAALLEMNPYAGQCQGYPEAIYLPAMAPSWLGPLTDGQWTMDVEGDCHDVPPDTCYLTSAGACGDGDRWICSQCFGSACLDATFQSECLPEADP